MAFSRKRIIYMYVSLALIFLVSLPMGVEAEEEKKDSTVLEDYEQDSPAGAGQEGGDTGDAEGKDAKSGQEIASADSLGFFDFFRMIAGFIFVIALLYIVLRFINKKSKAYQKGSAIKNLGGTGLGSNKSIQLVKIGGRIFIVGVGGNVQLLAEITDEDDIQAILDNDQADAELMLKPADIFSRLYQNRKVAKESGQPLSFQEQLKKQLSEMKNNRERLRREVEKKVKPDE